MLILTQMFLQSIIVMINIFTYTIAICGGCNILFYRDARIFEYGNVIIKSVMYDN